ncbi:IS3 family transposase [Legionella pneumophila serogroup 1]|uniref:IS3 family transposase n=1 Tax=Legionella anisa TaxID=28082 RepID=UPI00194E2F7A|nr:IS3 family transposase [Legionella anisa]
MLEQTPREQRRQFINVDNKDISIRRQCSLLGVNRSTLYYTSKATDVDDVGLLNEIRDIWNKYPFYGYRRITIELRKQGHVVNRKRVQRLMVLGGIYAIFPGPNTSRRNKRHAVHQYLLRDLEITRPNQAWMVDVTYLRMESGFVYLVALIDVHSRYIVGWSLSTTLETAFCMDALKSAMKHAIPEIINSDQGCQFTSEEWVNFLQEHNIQISMTGKGRCLDNVYIERFWRNIKREEFYINAYDSVKDLKKAIAKYMNFYNHMRPHQALGYHTPATIYFNEAPAAVA